MIFWYRKDFSPSSVLVEKTFMNRKGAGVTWKSSLLILEGFFLPSCKNGCKSRITTMKCLPKGCISLKGRKRMVDLKKKEKVGGNSEQCSVIFKSFRENIKQENIEQEEGG